MAELAEGIQKRYGTGEIPGGGGGHTISGSPTWFGVPEPRAHVCAKVGEMRPGGQGAGLKPDLGLSHKAAHSAALKNCAKGGTCSDFRLLPGVWKRRDTRLGAGSLREEDHPPRTQNTRGKAQEMAGARLGLCSRNVRHLKGSSELPIGN